jgi:hypothetical protein
MTASGQNLEVGDVGATRRAWKRPVQRHSNVALDRAVRGGGAGHHADDAVDELVALGLLRLEGEEVVDR